MVKITMLVLYANNTGMSTSLTIIIIILNTYMSDGQRSGLSSLSPFFNVFITSALSTPGYGILPREKISQQVTPYDH